MKIELEYFLLFILSLFVIHHEAMFLFFVCRVVMSLLREVVVILKSLKMV